MSTTLEEARDAISRANEMDNPGVRRARNGALVSSGYQTDRFGVVYGEEELKALNANGGRHFADLNTLVANGYVPQFQSAGDWYRMLAKDRQGSISDMFAKRNGDMLDSCAKAIGINTFEGDSAGLLIPPEVDSSLFRRRWSNSLWARTRTHTVTGNTMRFPRVKDYSRKTGSRSGGLQAFWRSEAGDAPPTRPEFEHLELRLRKLMVFVFVTEDMISDGGNVLETYLNEAVEDEFMWMTGNAIVRGDGAKEPQGYIHSDCKIVVDRQNGQAADTIIGKNIINMYKRRIAGAEQGGYEWHLLQEAESQLFELELGTGDSAVLVYLPPGGLSDSPYGRLLGSSVVPTEFNSALGTVGDIAYVNLNDMVSIEKGGVTQAVSPHVEFLTDQLCYRFIYRGDCKMRDAKPITPSNGTDTQSSVILLGAPAS